LCQIAGAIHFDILLLVLILVLGIPLSLEMNGYRTAFHGQAKLQDMFDNVVDLKAPRDYQSSRNFERDRLTVERPIQSR